MVVCACALVGIVPVASRTQQVELVNGPLIAHLTKQVERMS